MISDEEIQSKIVAVLAEEFELDEARLQPDATLYENLGLDSLDAVDMVVALEKAFGFKVVGDDADRENFMAVRTVQDIFSLVVSLSRRDGREI